ncbi:acyl dehydratase [Paraconexibacter algicola]|uniref:Acyl dehydratase n=1 Tax=Paraconexibacter algicola TaxID=2133960 RepID=A0A2T4UG89_9ACTN|nr:acyl dehydratase [Paraconexibacter algicola]
MGARAPRAHRRPGGRVAVRGRRRPPRLLRRPRLSGVPVDPAVVGRALDTVTVTIEPGKLRELARAFGEDPDAWGAVAPPTALVLADHLRADGIIDAPLAIGMDVERLLHGEASWDLVRPVRAGDVLTGTTVVEALDTREGRRGGTMTRATFATTFTDPAGAVVAVQRHVFVETGA